jgi:histidinol-phosphate aminotransferase
VNRVAQAGALAALADDVHLDWVRRSVIEARARIGRIAADHGLQALPSATNFVTVDCGFDGVFAQRLLAALVARDVFVRMPGVAPLDRCIRIGCGPSAVLDAFETALPDALQAVRC